MPTPSKALQRGFAAFQKQDYTAARRHLRGLAHPKAIHLLGLVEQADGNVERATRLLNKAARLAPDDAEVAANRARVANSAGDLALAESEYRRALSLQAGMLPAMAGLAQLLLDAGRYAESGVLFRELCRRAPADAAARHGLGSALLGESRSEEALGIFESLLADGVDRPPVRYMKGRAHLQLGQLDAARQDFRTAFDAIGDRLSLTALANTLWMSSDEAAFSDLLERAATVPTLAATAADLARQAGDPERALRMLANSAANDSRCHWVLATARLELGDAEQAEQIALQGLLASPDDDGLTRSLIISRLAQGKANEALEPIRRMRTREPLDQLWIAYEATALRHTDPAAYAHLVDVDRHVRAYTLPVPEGFTSLDEFNTALRATLDRWQVFATHPLDQSLRDGSQTVRDLTSIDDPVLHAFYATLKVPIQAYVDAIGESPQHPLSARNTGRFRFNGGWSVTLRGGGRHVNHVHPDGWISSSYYVAVPAPSDPAARDGCIKFGEPPFATAPASPPEKWVRPQAGMLVLFPSYLWHGTEPIRDGTVRITAPFDVLPAD